MIQLAIATLLLFVLTFGVGFIFNMLLKTTHFPVYLYMAVVIGMIVYWAVKGTLTENMSEYVVIAVPFIGGLIGAYLSGRVIHTLRVKGYKMF